MFLYAANDPVIESSNNLKFGPFNLAYPGLKQQAELAGLNTEVNKWNMIFDFTTNASGNLNFAVMNPSEWSLVFKKVESQPDEQPEVAFAFPVRYGGTIPDDAKFASSAEDSNGMMAFGFDHSQAQAQLKASEMQKQIEHPNLEQQNFNAFGFDSSMQMNAQQFMNE